MATEAGELQVFVRYTPSELYRASLRLFFRQPICWLVAGSVFVFSLNSFLNESGTEAWAKGISFLFAICLWLFLVPWTVSRRTFNASHMKNGVTLVFSDQGIRAEYTGIEVFTDWNQIKAGFETSDAIIIKIAKAAHVIPKSQITSEQCDNLKRIVRAHVPKAFV